MALQTMVALHKAKVGTNGKPWVDIITAVDAEVIAVEAVVGLVDTVGMGAGNNCVGYTSTDTHGPLGYSRLLQKTKEKKEYDTFHGK